MNAFGLFLKKCDDFNILGLLANTDFGKYMILRTTENAAGIR